MILFEKKLPFCFTALASFGALVTAYGSEHFLGLKPCELCYYQRYAFFVILFVALLFALWAGARTYQKRFFGLLLLSLLFAGNGGIAGYQVLVEKKIIPAPKVCRAKKAKTLEELRAQLEKGPPVSCDKVTWSLFGISMAGYGVLYNLAFVLYLLTCLEYGRRRNDP